jgi:hypothetical protein
MRPAARRSKHEHRSPDGASRTIRIPRRRAKVSGQVMIKGGGKVPPDISSVRDTLSTILPGRATDRLVGSIISNND